MSDTVRVLGIHEFLALEPQPDPEEADPLRTCTRHGCFNRIPHPTRRRADVHGDYCTRRCVPMWLRDLPASHHQRPTDRWLRSGEATTAPVHVEPQPLKPEPVPEPEPVPVPVPDMPQHHQACGDCGDPVHTLLASSGRCAPCVTAYVFARTAQHDEQNPATVGATP